MTAERRIPNPEDIPVMSDERVAFLRSKTPAERVQLMFDLNKRRRAMMGDHLRKRHPDWSEERITLEIGFRLRARSGDYLPEHALVMAMMRYKRKPCQERWDAAVGTAGNDRVSLRLVTLWAKRLDVEDVWQAVLRRVQKP